MKLFRAVGKKNFNPDQKYLARPSRRLPSNVPYMVDNLWEWLRPEHAPCRRQAIYASPTPELALVNASSSGISREDYVVCKLELPNCSIKLAQLTVTDARHHPDIHAIQKKVLAVIGDGFADLSLQVKMTYAPLFIPGVAQEELNKYFETDGVTKMLADEIRKVSTFWSQGINFEIDQNCDGELFFEIPAGESYRLHPLSVG